MTAACQSVDPLGPGGGPALWQRVVEDMCPDCPIRKRCAQSAVDAPFDPVGPWGGYVLPRDLAALRRDLSPTTQAAYEPERYHERSRTNRNGAGRYPWWAHMGRNYDSQPGRMRTGRAIRS